jgi:hypothetical protein
MPYYRPGIERGFSRFNTFDVMGRMPLWLVTDEYLNALERAYHQGQYDAGISNVEDTSSIVFDFLAVNNITTTEQAYALGRAQSDPDPGGSVDPNFLSGTANTPGLFPNTPAAQPAAYVPIGGVPMPGQQDANGTVTTSVQSREGYQGPPDVRYSGPPGGAVGGWAGGSSGIASQPTNSGSYPAFGSSSGILASFSNPYMLAAAALLAYFIFKRKG